MPKKRKLQYCEYLTANTFFNFLLHFRFPKIGWIVYSHLNMYLKFKFWVLELVEYFFTFCNFQLHFHNKKLPEFFFMKFSYLVKIWYLKTVKVRKHINAELSEVFTVPKTVLHFIPAHLETGHTASQTAHQNLFTFLRKSSKNLAKWRILGQLPKWFVIEWRMKNR